MSSIDRRQILKSLLGKLTQTAGTLVVASAAVECLENKLIATEENQPLQPETLEERVNLVVENNLTAASETETSQFLNGPLGGFGNGAFGGFRNGAFGGFGNGPLGGFRNGAFGGFTNSPLGGFRNSPIGGFKNTPMGSFTNGGWPNGGIGGFGGFRNGGWSNGFGGWRNW